MQEQYTERFHQLTTDDVKEKKIINVEVHEEHSEKALKSPINNLSVKLSDVLPSILHIDLIEKKAIRILNMPKALVHCPTFDEDVQSRKFMVAKEDGKYYSVSVMSNSKIRCDCKGFK